jgi:hypothetical protein
MNPHNKIFTKQHLKQLAIDLIGQRITAAKAAIDAAQQSANQEEKSSAGDKYETGRAMGHLQKDMHARQLGENLKELSTLETINVNGLFGTVKTGAVVQTEGLTFFLAAGLGKQTYQDQTVIFLSPQAPLAKLMLGKTTGDRFVFNGASLQIVEVY